MPTMMERITVSLLQMNATQHSTGINRVHKNAVKLHSILYYINETDISATIM